MGTVVVTGVAGFIGSHLAERLVADDRDVVGIDCFTDYYDIALKRRNLEALNRSPRFRFHELDLRAADLTVALEHADRVIHLAAQPGVRASWGTGLRACMDHNVVALGNLLDQCRPRAIERIVVASSSSVYGNAGQGPVRESQRLAPVSPYGLSKAAAEGLCNMYASSFDMPLTVLRYFTVYGPRQRPDMLICRLVRSALGGPPVPIYGTRSSARSFTHVTDVVDATVRSLTAPLPPATILNISAAQSLTIAAVAGAVASVVGRPPKLNVHPALPGDVSATWGDTRAAHLHLGWRPRTSMSDGVANQVEWALQQRSSIGLVRHSTDRGADTDVPEVPPAATPIR